MVGTLIKTNFITNKVKITFSELFLFTFFRPPNPKSEKNPHKSTNKKILT